MEGIGYLDMKVSLEKIVFELCIAMPLLYTATYMLNDGNANKVVICHLIVSFALLIKQLAAKGKRTTFLVITFGTLFYVMYTSWIIYPQYIMHSYFYTYLFAIVLFVLFSDEELREEFYLYFINAKKRFFLYSVLLTILIVYTIINGSGLRRTISMPVLYGPFTIPHYLSYILLVVYCGVYLQYKDSDRKFFPLILRGLIAICIIWTAVRSTAVALVILVAYEFLSIKSFEKKSLIIAICAIVGLYLLLETDILVHNPLVEKTMYAASNNGSITNNREWFRKAALSYYKNDIGLVKQIFGAGMPNLVDAIDRSVGAKIHAHNDYVNMLVGYGGVGLISFVIAQFGLVDIRSKFWTAIFLQGFIFVLAYSNGFALYTMLTSSMPIIILFFERINSNSLNESEENK